MAGEQDSFEKLKEYLRIVVDMEKEIFMQSQTIKSMTNTHDRLGVPQIIRQSIEDDVSGYLFKLPLIVIGLVVAVSVVFGVYYSYYYIDMRVANNPAVAFGFFSL